jgi:XTP/dITP diphosphohydrolase
VELVLATHNKDKVKEIRPFLQDLGIRLIPLDALAPEVVEDGDSYEANAKKKAVTAMKYTGKMSLADDTGLEVDALGGQPGLFSARFAGEGVTYADNRRKLLSLLEGVPESQRTARFRCVMVLALPGGKTQTVEGVIDGMIPIQEKGSSGFGYDAVFLLPEIGKTLGELAIEEKNRLSHRAKALNQVREILKKLNQTDGAAAGGAFGTGGTCLSAGRSDS